MRTCMHYFLFFFLYWVISSSILHCQSYSSLYHSIENATSLYNISSLNDEGYLDSCIKNSSYINELTFLFSISLYFYSKSLEYSFLFMRECSIVSFVNSKELGFVGYFLKKEDHFFLSFYLDENSSSQIIPYLEYINVI